MKNTKNIENMQNILDYVKNEIAVNNAIKESGKETFIMARIFQELGNRFEELPTFEEFKREFPSILQYAMSFYDVDYKEEVNISYPPYIVTKPKTQKITTDAITRKLGKGIELNTETTIALREQDKMSIIVSSVYDEWVVNSSKINKLMSVEDLRIMEVIGNLYLAQDKPYLRITTNQIYREIHKNDSSNPGEDAIREIDKAIDKMSMIRIELNKEKLENEEIKKKIKSIPVKGNILDAIQWADLDTKQNKYSTTWVFNRVPLLFDFAESIGDIWTIPSRYRKKIISNQSLQHVLLQQIAYLQRSNFDHVELNFATIYERLNLQESGYKTRRSYLNALARIRKQTESFLQACKGDLIDGYTCTNEKIMMIKKQEKALKVEE